MFSSFSIEERIPYKYYLKISSVDVFSNFFTAFLSAISSNYYTYFLSYFGLILTSILEDGFKHFLFIFFRNFKAISGAFLGNTV